MKLYRIVSHDEREDFQKYRFRTSRNTLEAKQFFKSEIAIREFYRDSLIQGYQPPYSFLISVDISEECLNMILFDTQELDTFEAVTVFEPDLPAFNDCINFTDIHAL